MDLLSDLHDDGLTLVLVTHDVEIGAAAPRLVRMVDGRIVDDRRRTETPDLPMAAGAGTVR
jgi:putative ABC transport system ATP-binding protein